MIMMLSLSAPFSEPERKTVMYLLLILISMAAVVRSCLPFTGLRAFICVTMAVGTFAALRLLPTLFEVTAVTSQMAVTLLFGVVISGLILFLTEQILAAAGARCNFSGKMKHFEI